MKRSSSTFVAIALTVLLVIAGSLYWLRVKSPLSLLQGAPISAPEAALFIPKDAPLVASLLANPDRLQGLRQMRTPLLKRGESSAEFDRFKRSLLADTDLDYDRDIQPWLGDEVTLAITHLDGDGDRRNGTQPDYLVALAVKDAPKSREFLDLFWQNKAAAGADLEFEDYKGVELVSTKPQKSLFPLRSKTQKLNFNPFSSRSANVWASATVSDRFVLFANSADGLRQAINRVQVGDLNLTNSPTYQKALTYLTQKRLGLVYVDIARIAAWTSKTPMGSQRIANPLAIAFAADSRGLLADAMWLAQPDAFPTFPTIAKPVAALEYIPETSAFAIAGTDLDRLWQQLDRIRSSNPLLTRAIESAIDRWNANFGISLAEDIFSWVKGEYALALVPREDTQLDWVFVAQTSDTAAASIEHLDKIAADRGYSVGPFTLKGEHRVVAWTKLSAAEDESGSGPRLQLAAQVRGVRGNVDKYEIFTSSIEVMDRAFGAPRNGSLRSLEGFATGLGIFPAQNDGYLYANWDDSKLPLERQFPALKFIELAGESFFAHLKSFTTSSYKSDSGFERTGILFQLRS
ncbi:DUF3352 domain-containing protein [Oscillatoriales cyanobacterium LEGE 11467]|uniref:DUF3352 domain-containing protein n=1 Tax=Zarconia navalis LEGE 11467 TaxID=1828826 RepID=A0A928Z8H1_9CYAN|nr:DUF3352 domain-containing protein [Zarconia navalis]MBE9042487.1 DUF3352 domain-containing protein [Zarconia navalis LEGE 11467]